MKKTKAQRRVAVAKDALQQLKSGKYKAVELSTIILPTAIQKAVNMGIEDDAQTYLKSYPGSCKVCVRGALFLSLIRKENDWPLSELYAEYTDCKLDTLFTYDQYKLMEAYYEGWHHKKHDGNEWWRLNPDPDKRLELILKNIIKNNGLFKPSKLK